MRVDLSPLRKAIQERKTHAEIAMELNDFEASLRSKAFEIEVYDINMVLRKHKVIHLEEILGDE